MVSIFDLCHILLRKTSFSQTSSPEGYNLMLQIYCFLHKKKCFFPISTIKTDSYTHFCSNFHLNTFTSVSVLLKNGPNMYSNTHTYCDCLRLWNCLKWLDLDLMNGQNFPSDLVGRPSGLWNKILFDWLEVKIVNNRYSAKQ